MQQLCPIIYTCFIFNTYTTARVNQSLAFKNISENPVQQVQASWGLRLSNVKTAALNTSNQPLTFNCHHTHTHTQKIYIINSNDASLLHDRQGPAVADGTEPVGKYIRWHKSIRRLSPPPRFRGSKSVFILVSFFFLLHQLSTTCGPIMKGPLRLSKWLNICHVNTLWKGCAHQKKKKKSITAISPECKWSFILLTLTRQKC